MDVKFKTATATKPEIIYVRMEMAHSPTSILI
jgi:hypothetical protein